MEALIRSHPLKALSLCLLLITMLFIHLDRAFLKQNHGFCLWHIYSSGKALTNFDDAMIATSHRQDVVLALEKPFTYLGKGHQSYVFESADHKYVLKLYHFSGAMRPWGWISKPLSFMSVKRKQIDAYDREKFILTQKSHALAFSLFQSESALAMLHMEKTRNCPYKATLVDALGQKYVVSLKDTSFLIQKKGDLIYPRLEELIASGNDKQAQLLLYNITEFLNARHLKRIRDNDAMLHKNYGLLNDNPFQLDTGRLVEDPRISSNAEAEKETLRIMTPLYDWLEDTFPKFPLKP